MGDITERAMGCVMTFFFAAGVTFGLSAGLTPGPLMTLVIAESLRAGWRAGVRVALSPLITDSVLISLSLLLLAPIPSAGLAVIGVVGGCYMIYMGWGTYRATEKLPQAGHVSPHTSLSRSLWKGVATNILNPAAILFWLTTGGPKLREAWYALGWTGPAVFIVPFFALLVGTKVFVALGVGSGSRFLSGNGYRVALATAGAALAALGLWTIWTSAGVLI